MEKWHPCKRVTIYIGIVHVFDMEIGKKSSVDYKGESATENIFTRAKFI